MAGREDTSSENLCHSGAASLTRYDVAIRSRSVLELCSGCGQADFATCRRVVHVCDAASMGGKVGVQ